MTLIEEARAWFYENDDICGYEDLSDVYYRHVPIKFYGLLDDEIEGKLKEIADAFEHERIELDMLHTLYNGAVT